MGHMPKKKQKQRALNVMVSDELHAEVKKAAVDSRLSVTSFITHLVIEHLRRKGRVA